MTSARTRIVLTLASTALVGACMSDNEYRAKQEAMARNAMERSSKAYGQAQAQLSGREKALASRANSLGSRVTTGERAERLAQVEVPFEKMTGYVVRGSDESSFLKCGDTGVHYTRMSASAVGQLVQRYRFKASRPLAPVYFTINARIIEDTVTVGENAYKSVVEIERVYPEVRDERPACAPPARGSLIEGRQVSRR